jgi:hypothetical protein
MSKIIISDKDDLVFNLSSIGVKNTTLNLEEDTSYLLSEDIYIEIPDRKDIHKLVRVKSENTIIITDGDSQLSLTKDQFIEIRRIIDEFAY